MSIKAYKISCRDGDHGAEVRFAERGKELRGHRTEMCDCEYIDLTVKRSPEFDYLAPGPLTIGDYLNHGWYWECGVCQKHCYADDGFGNAEGGLVIVGDYVYCGTQCVERKIKMYDKWLGEERCHESISEHRAALVDYMKANGEVLK